MTPCTPAYLPVLSIPCWWEWQVVHLASNAAAWCCRCACWGWSGSLVLLVLCWCSGGSGSRLPEWDLGSSSQSKITIGWRKSFRTRATIAPVRPPLLLPLITVFSSSSSSKPRVWLKTLFFQHVVGLILMVPLDDEVGIVGRLSLWCRRSLLLWRLGLHLLSVGFCWRIIHAWRRGREVVDIRPLPRTTWTPHLLECTEESPSRFAHTWNQESTRTHNNSKRLH